MLFELCLERERQLMQVPIRHAVGTCHVQSVYFILIPNLDNAPKDSHKSDPLLYRTVAPPRIKNRCI